MKTRTLLLLALGCGLAIMLAGAVLLFQLSAQDEAVLPTSIGEPVEVGDVMITVYGAGNDRDGRFVVEVELRAPADTDPSTGFTLLTPDGPVAPGAVECSERCAVSFPTSGVGLVYRRGDEQARWVLE